MHLPTDAMIHAGRCAIAEMPPEEDYKQAQACWQAMSAEVNDVDGIVALLDDAAAKLVWVDGLDETSRKAALEAIFGAMKTLEQTR